MKEFNVAKGLKNGSLEYHMSHGPINVVICGDSVSHGCLNYLSNHFDTVYHARLRMMLNTAYPDIPVNIINNGVGGMCADYAVKNFERDVACHHPDLVIVCFGLNDVNGPIENYLGNLGELFDKVNALGTDCIFMTPNMMNTHLVDDDLYPHAGERQYARITMEYQLGGRMDEYIGAAKELAESKGITVCDCYAKWKAMHEDGVDVTMHLINYINHPTREMHALFAESLYETIMGEPYTGAQVLDVDGGMYKGEISK
ncbi:MAG: SGNH/GDSL hydrolase family protein [Clostridia bacterium]|nr:SGNH/GDSL hydrolase family protein [Clostridia bacterium]